MRLGTSLLTAATILRLTSTSSAAAESTRTCTLRPLGHGRDDSDQVRSHGPGQGGLMNVGQAEAAIARCGKFGHTVFEPGQYNITRCVGYGVLL